MQNTGQNEAKPEITTHNQFAEWLKAVPELPEGERITIALPITLRVRDWLDIAHAGAVHGDSLAEAVSQLLEDVSLTDELANEQEYPSDVQRRDDEARRKNRAMEALLGDGKGGVR